MLNHILSATPITSAGASGPLSIVGQMSGRSFTADDVLSPYIWVFYASFCVSFVFTPIMRGVALFYGIIDQPDRVRKMHSVPVAYLGGVAVFLGWITGMALSQFLRLHRIDPGWPISHPSVNFSIILGAMVVVLLGLWDDIFGVKPLVKICFQGVAAVALLVDDVGVECTRPMLEPLVTYVCAAFHLSNPLVGFVPAWFDALVLVSSAVFVVLVVVGCCNATNLMDGLDGLCGGVTAIVAVGFVFVAVHQAMFGGGVNTNWDALRVIMGLALLGAVLGFVPFNFNPASIFMGDTGSMFLGYCCGVMIILMAQERPKWFLAAMVMFALPVLDTALAFARRWIAGRPLFTADAQHFHHQLVQRGYSVKQTVVLAYGLAIMFAILGAAIVFMRTRYAGASYLVIFGSVIVAAYKMGMVHERPRGAGTPSTLSDVTSVSAPSTNGGPHVSVADRGDVFELPDVAGRTGALRLIKVNVTGTQDGFGSIDRGDDLRVGSD